MTEQSRPLAYWVALVSRRLDERFDDALEEHGVTSGQWQVLARLRRAPLEPDQLQHTSATPDDLAELLESGWIARGAQLELTERGRTASDRLQEVVDDIGGLLERTLTEPEAAAVSAALSRAVDELGWAEPTAS